MIGTTPTNNREETTVKNFIVTTPTKHNTQILNIKSTTCQIENTHTLSNRLTNPQSPKLHVIMVTTCTITTQRFKLGLPTYTPTDNLLILMALFSKFIMGPHPQITEQKKIYYLKVNNWQP